MQAERLAGRCGSSRMTPNKLSNSSPLSSSAALWYPALSCLSSEAANRICSGGAVCIIHNKACETHLVAVNSLTKSLSAGDTEILETFL